MEKKILFYKWFFSLFFFLFSAILFLDRAIVLGISFLFFGLYILPVEKVKAMWGRIPSLMRKGLAVLAGLGIYLSMVRIVNL